MSDLPLDQPVWLSIGAYAGVYGVSRSTVRKWQACGLVDSYRVARVIRVKNQPPGTARAAAPEPVPEGPTRKGRRQTR